MVLNKHGFKTMDRGFARVLENSMDRKNYIAFQNYPGPRGFLTREKEAARENLWLRRCESHYHATIGVNQHHEID